MNFAVLSAELSTDPLGRGYSGMTAEQATTDLNTAYRTKYRLLTTRDLLRWGYGREGLSKLADAANKEGTFTGISDANRAKAIAAFKIITQGIEGELDISDSEIDGMLDSLVATGIFLAQDKTDLQTRATENITRAEELGLPAVRVGEVEEVKV